MNKSILSYKDLIKEAFIDPIRTVTIIDDEYPTLKSLLMEKITNKVTPAEQLTNYNLMRLQNIISMCHETYRWSVDVFDGSEAIEDGVYSHLNHSDLIILDYHLEGDASSDDGKKARNLINFLNKNNHFNIILVHTKGTNGNIQTVFEDILFTFDISLPSEYKVDSNVKTLLDDLADESDDSSKLFLNRSLNKINLLKKIKSHGKNALNINSPKFIFNEFKDEIELLGKNKHISSEDITKWLICDAFKNKVAQEKIDQSFIKWSWTDENNNYISTGRVFISIIKKSEIQNPSSELLEGLVRALNELEPPPMQLIMAKMRHELDEQGMEQANVITENNYIQAGWLYNLLKNEDNISAHDKAINLHWEQLTNTLQEKLRDFSRRIISSIKFQYAGTEQSDPNSSIIKHFFQECSNEQDLVTAHLNAYSCSMPTIGRFITTGSILEFSSRESDDKELWLCLTPACDLIPIQNRKKWQERIGENRLGLKCVKLKEASRKEANGAASTNEFLYLKLDQDICSYKLGERTQTPEWDVFYLDIDSNLQTNNIFSLYALRYYENELKAKVFTAKIVGELRYEYALNFLHKLGTTQTRVGLDFVKKDELWK